SFCSFHSEFDLHDLVFGLPRNEASIDDKRSASRELSVIRSEIENGRGDFFAGANPTDGSDRDDLIAHLVSGEAVEHFGADHTRSYGVAANVLFSELEGCGFRKSFNRVLGRNINTNLRQTDVTGNAGSIDD